MMLYSRNMIHLWRYQPPWKEDRLMECPSWLAEQLGFSGPPLLVHALWRGMLSCSALPWHNVTPVCPLHQCQELERAFRHEWWCHRNQRNSRRREHTLACIIETGMQAIGLPSEWNLPNQVGMQKFRIQYQCSKAKSEEESNWKKWNMRG